MKNESYLIISTVVFGVCLTAPVASAPSPQEQVATNVECVTRLQLPEYPPIAVSALMPGTIEAEIDLGEAGVPAVTRFTLAPRPEMRRAFAPYIEKAIRGSQFASKCTGKTVRLVFRFRLDTKPARGVWFEYPNIFEIGAAKPQVNTKMP